VAQHGIIIDLGPIKISHRMSTISLYNVKFNLDKPENVGELAKPGKLRPTFGGFTGTSAAYYNVDLTCGWLICTRKLPYFHEILS
jgi:hypothetical protein